VLALAVGEAAPPGPFILLHSVLLLLGGCSLAETEPEEGPPPVLFVLLVLSYIEVSIRVDL
jgi:hypothetical protein